MTAPDHRLALALEAAELGTWTWDIASGSTTWDTRLEELHGLAPGAFGGRFEDWLEAIYPDDRAECLARVEKALADPGPYSLLHRTFRSDGTVRYVECRGTVLVGDEGEPIGTTGVAVDVTARERRRQAKDELLSNQHKIIETLQQALLPAVLPQSADVRVATRYISAERDIAIGGDWYAVVPLSRGRLGLAIGDVAGHGLGAISDMAAARFGLRALALGEPNPDVVLARLNDSVRVFEPDTMITALYGIVDPAEHVWTYSSAGHCPVLVRSADGRAHFLDGPSDPPLGWAGSFHSHRAELPPGAMLVLFTDGLVERRIEPITVGLERLRRACMSGPSDPELLCDHLRREMFAGSVADDDVAIVVAALE